MVRITNIIKFHIFFPKNKILYKKKYRVKNNYLRLLTLGSIHLKSNETNSYLDFLTRNIIITTIIQIKYILIIYQMDRLKWKKNYI